MITFKKEYENNKMIFRFYSFDNGLGFSMDNIKDLISLMWQSNVAHTQKDLLDKYVNAYDDITISNNKC